jgi:hypothetical protein
MLGEMIGVETGAIVGLGDFEAVLVIVREGAVVAIKMIKTPNSIFSTLAQTD